MAVVLNRPHMGRGIMQCILLAFIAVVGVSAATGCVAIAKEYPVCLIGGASDQRQCEFANIDQCQATASGGLGSCAPNPSLGIVSAALGRPLHKR